MSLFHVTATVPDASSSVNFLELQVVLESKIRFGEALFMPKISQFYTSFYNTRHSQVASGLTGQSSLLLGGLQVKWARVWLLTWWLTVDILCTVYTGILVAHLTARATPALLHTLEEVAASNIM